MDDRLVKWETQKRDPLYILMGISSGKFPPSKVKKLKNLAVEKSTWLLLGDLH